ncbi:GGDEF domain-containing protein [Microbacterium stercoris]|uniref:Sensor domain-containing diguanylate cyclase n=1 Tax=Microbacterium stercoris TaxID=2820289 RepID=A0A939QJB1_9MICO|nr:sensor domain-containing diguanylate cyclase [Microbacterium stercoris]MBO3663952.1 sensor domain-containing diguanylate cyclase [Microbacterium stercoris]
MTETTPTIDGVAVLVGAVQELALATSLDDVVRIVRIAARELTGADGATFVLRDGDKCFYVEENAIEPLWRGQRFPLEACISGWSMLSKSVAVIPDIYADDRIPHDAYRPTFVKSLVMVPIRSVDPIGAIGNYWAEEHHATEGEVRLLQALADSTSVAMAHVNIRAELEARVRVESELTRLSSTDELTGLLNRRGFWEHAGPALGDGDTARRPAVMAFVDMDGLKRTNDTRGHAAGDEAIRAVGRALDLIARPGDVVSRFGGDEFAAIYVEPGIELEQLRRRILDEISSHGVAASVGLYEVAPGDVIAVDALLARADALMYVEKNRSRGVAPEGVRPPVSRA